MYGAITIVTLPSGERVRAKKPSLVTLFASGLFPNDLTRHAIRLYNRDITKPSTLQETDMESASQMLRLMDVFIPKLLVDPVVGDKTEVSMAEVEVNGEKIPVQTGTVALIDIPDPDKQWLFLWGQGLLPDDASKPLAPPAEAVPAAAEVAPFRDGDERPAAGSDRAAVPPAAVEPASDPAGAPVSA